MKATCISSHNMKSSDILLFRARHLQVPKIENFSAFKKGRY